MTTKRILIVEDDALAALLLEDTLRGAGYGVAGPARTPGEAITAAEAQKPELALVDIRLQGASDGVEVARALCARGVEVLFMSGQPWEAARHAGLARGLLRKPYTSQDVLTTLAVLFGAAAPPPPNLELYGSA